MQPRIYTYKITFEEVSYYYYGVHREKKFNEEYWGSPKTNKWCWELYTPKKQILEFFDFTDEGWMEAQEVEKKLITPFYNTDKWCLNASCGSKVSLLTCSNAGKKSKELSLGIHGLTLEQRRENARKAGKIGSKKIKDLGLGIFGLTPEQNSENGRKGGKIGGKISAKITNAQKWECTETGFITNPGALTRYQNKRGIDTSNRIRIE